MNNFSLKVIEENLKTKTTKESITYIDNLPIEMRAVAIHCVAATAIKDDVFDSVWDTIIMSTFN